MNCHEIEQDAREIAAAHWNRRPTRKPKQARYYVRPSPNLSGWFDVLDRDRPGWANEICGRTDANKRCRRLNLQAEGKPAPESDGAAGK